MEAILTVPRVGQLVPRVGQQYSDGLLSPGEFVDVPFVVCLKELSGFRFNVDVLGLTR